MSYSTFPAAVNSRPRIPLCYKSQHSLSDLVCVGLFYCLVTEKPHVSHMVAIWKEIFLNDITNSMFLNNGNFLNEMDYFILERLKAQPGM